MMKVSVIIPVYHKAKYIEGSVQSALNCPEVAEILLIEDGSSDNSFEICKRLAGDEPRVSLFTHPRHENRGVSASRNLGLREANCDFIAFLDADDLYLEHRFEEDKQLFEHSGVDGVYHAVGTKFYSGKAREQYHEALLTAPSKTLSPQQLPYALLHILNNVYGHIHLDGLTLRKAIVEHSGGFNEALNVHEDSEWIFRISMQHNLYPGTLEEPVALRGVHDGFHLSREIDWDTRHEYYRIIKVFLKRSNGDPLMMAQVKQNLQWVKAEQASTDQESLVEVKYRLLEMYYMLQKKLYRMLYRIIR